MFRWLYCYDHLLWFWLFERARLQDSSLKTRKGGASNSKSGHLRRKGFQGNKSSSLKSWVSNMSKPQQKTIWWLSSYILQKLWLCIIGQKGGARKERSAYRNIYDAFLLLISINPRGHWPEGP
jgi:hypothetical protein